MLVNANLCLQIFNHPRKRVNFSNRPVKLTTNESKVRMAEEV